MFRHSTLSLSKAATALRPSHRVARFRNDVAAAAAFSRRTIGGFQPLRPPSPEELGAPKAAKQYKKGRRWTRWLVIGLVAGGTIYITDRQVYASGFGRTLRTFTTTLLVALDYKINFRPEPITAGSVPELHARNAERLFDLLRVNGGLYLKIGQAIAMQSAVLPPEFQKMFGRMFDDAPQDDWKDVEAVIRRDFGKSVEEVFGVSFTGKEGMGIMERKARASASVAQVHWARLPDGREVAIKIQKREIAKQIAWDLWAFKYVFQKMVFFIRGEKQMKMLTNLFVKDGNVDLLKVVRSPSLHARSVHHRTSRVGNRFCQRGQEFGDDEKPRQL